MTNKNKIFRGVTLAFQIISILAYFIPTLIGGSIGGGWLVIGVIHTILFCTIFFRDARRRTALSIMLMIIIILWCLLMLILGGILAISGLGINVAAILIYGLSSLLAATFALANPRKFY